MKVDMKFKPKTTNPAGSITKQIHLPPGYYSNLKEAWIAIAYEIEKQRSEVMMTIDGTKIDDIAKRKELVKANLYQLYVKISDASIANELDSLFLQYSTQHAI